MGLPTVAMGLLGIVMLPAQAAALLVLPATVTNIWQLFAGPHFAVVWRRLWPMMLGICVGTWAGSGILTGANSKAATLALGLTLVLYALSGLANLHLTVQRRHESWVAPVIGLTTGIITGVTGVFAVPAIPYLQALKFSKDELVQALGLSFTISTVALGASLIGEGVLGLSLMSMSSAALLPAMAGMWLGQRIRGRVSETGFRRVFLLGLLMLGVYLAARNWP